MKILICSLTYSLPNGVTVSINTSADELIKKGVEVRIISPNYGVGKFRPEHFPVTSSTLARSIGVLIGKEERIFGIGAYAEIKKIAQEFDPDVYWLHTLTWGANAFERYMLKSNKVKVITYHTMVEEYGRIYAGKFGVFLMRKRSKSVCNKMDIIITPSQAMETKLKEYGVIKPINVIPTGIEMTKEPIKREELCKIYDIPPNNKIILFVGRISKEKNLNVLLNMMKDLKDVKYNATLLLVGPGDIDKTKKNARRLDLADMVIFTGALAKRDTEKIYGACDAFVFSSQTETQGLVIGEAMMAGIPVIALDSPIQKEVYPEEAAVVIHQESEFAKEVMNVLDNKKRREDIIKNANEFVFSKFNKELMIDRQMKIFKDLV